MRYSEIIDEEVNNKNLILYHGTKSDAFEKFNPHAIQRDSKYWNPLGNGMYATNDPRFAARFGPNVYKVLIPIGCRFKRFNQSSWRGTAFSLVIRSLKAAFKRCGENYEHWDNGKPIVNSANKKMSREQIIDALINCLSRRPDWSLEKEIITRNNVSKISDEDLLAELKNKVRFGGRDRDYEKGRKISNFRIELAKIINDLSPYKGLYESAALIRSIFGDEIMDAYEDILPKISDSIFGKYDFILFKENNNKTLEVVIFNPELQTTSNENIL